MKYSRHSVSLATFGLAFGIALSPALMQSEDLSCTLEPPIGDTELVLLEVEVAGENLIAFDPLQREYDVMFSSASQQVIVRAQSSDANSEVMYNISVGAPPPFDHGHFPIGGGEITFDEWPVGESILRVYVHAPEGASGSYDVRMAKLAL